MGGCDYGKGFQIGTLQKSDFAAVCSPLLFLQSRLGTLPHPQLLQVEDRWWAQGGRDTGEAVDRAGTPWLRTFDQLGKRIDEILFAPEYYAMLTRGYRAGVVWRAIEQRSMVASSLLTYIISFNDPGICCPYTVSLGTATPLAKYGSAELQQRFLPQLLRRDDTVWQGATWMTEIKGGSDLGNTVETVAREADDAWQLTGDKYFASNIGAQLAVVAARPEGAPSGVRGLALFLVPRYRENGDLNYFIRRIKDKIATRSVPTGEVELRDAEGYQLSAPDSGIYQILEVLNLSRVANSVVSVALAQRAIAEAFVFAQNRKAFGKHLFEHPLLRYQFEERLLKLQEAFALAWEAVRLLDEVWMEQPPYSNRYHFFRLVAHLAKYWTAEFAVETAKWNMEVHGGLGVLGEHGAERWLREAMILAIWEGTSHRQILDGVEVMERKQAHRMLFESLSATQVPSADLGAMESCVDRYLQLPGEEREAVAEPLFRNLAEFTANALTRKTQG